MVNYAKGGLATASLIQQLQGLAAQPVRCPTAIIAIGTNDAMLPLSDQQFQANLAQILALVRGLGAEHIHLLPAFYSTVAASQRPSMAGPIWRIDQLNGLIQAVAVQEQVPVQAAVVQPLFEAAALRSDYTVDGVHLNEAGKAVYRKGLLGLVQQTGDGRSAGAPAVAGQGN
ncbi:SGNH/GDSL hydrolase family protein [Synechococcus sp. Tobar12-5m-g]|nr:SGNH/GDSL hydrolase family protein [Synechococcus sp. Tobar12-5m-g]